jgi:hypothetical protein
MINRTYGTLTNKKGMEKQAYLEAQKPRQTKVKGVCKWL